LKAWRGIAAAALLVGGCGGGDETGPPEIEEQERRLGAEQHPVLLAEFGGSYEGEESAYVKRIGEQLSVKADLGQQCTFTVVNSDVVNAFAVPGCYIYITRGLMGIVNSEAEMASVLAHELGHIVADHSERQQKRSLLRNLGVLAVGLVTGSERLTQIAGHAAQFFTLRYSRKQEYQSDDLGIRYLRQAGYDPFAAADMLDALGRQERFMNATRTRDEARSIPEWGRTHPLTENRIARARETAAATGTSPDALPENEARYLKVLDGLLYGDDPQQGFVQGRRFAHPVMRIGFEAPEGFKLTNSPQAILIEGPDGLRGEFGGGRLSAGGLEAYVSALLKQMLGDAQAQAQAQAQAGTPQRGLVNGVSALFVPVVVQTRQGPVEMSVAAYAGSARDAFHFIMISSPSTGAVAAISELFQSFRLLSEEEVRALKPREIHVVAVGPTDSARSLSAAMATDNKLDHFLMLNGRSADQPLRPGELVKIVRFAGR
jgi:predicted Zn-dependent protease